MFVLGDRLRSEFLAVPQLVRIAFPDNDADVALLIKANSLVLKYLVRLKTFTLTIERLGDTGYVLYAVRVDDDPEHPATVWSLLETDNELQALHKLVGDGRCSVCLFNEGALNVCCTDTILGIDKVRAALIVSGAQLPAEGELSQLRELVSSTLELPMADRTGALVVKPTSDCVWQAVLNAYITNRLEKSVLDLVNGDEGDQQESLAVWLTDVLSVAGSVKSPQIHEEKGPRELTDVLLGYLGGCFLIESKTLSVLERSELPNRAKLKKNVLKNVSKALSQLPGACRNIKRGLKITDKQGNEVTVDRSQPVHCILLVPDLSLFDESDNLGGDFLKGFSKDTGCFLHILDPSALLRSVQHALMFSKNSKMGLPPIMAFDSALITRWQECIKHATPNIDLLMTVV